MSERNVIITSFVLVSMVLIGVIFVGNNKNEPVIIKVSASLEAKTIDDLIEEAELIVIGNIKTILPSRWKSPNGNVSQNLTVDEIFQSNLSIFTDTLISIEKILKGENGEQIGRVRSFIGKIDKYQFVNSVEPYYEKGQDYLLFLHKDVGPTQIVDPGDYIAVNAIYGVYKIIDDKAISKGDEWVLEELKAYIQKSLSAENPSPALSPAPTELWVETLTPFPMPTETLYPTLPAELLTKTPTETTTPTETVSPTP